MTRRDFISLLGGAAATSSMLGPLAAAAQADAVRRIVMLTAMAESDPKHRPASPHSSRGCARSDGSTAATSGSIFAGAAAMQEDFACSPRRWSSASPT